MEVRINNNTTENNEAIVSVDEKALSALIKDLVGTQASTDSTKAMDALRSLVQVKANECKNVVSVKDLEAMEENRDTVVEPVEPVATTETKEEYPTASKKEEGNNMEELKKNIVLMELTKLKIQLGECNSHKIVEMALRYIEDNYNSTKLVVSLTKICYNERDSYKSVIRMLEPLKKIGYSKFDEIFRIIVDVEFHC